MAMKKEILLFGDQTIQILPKIKEIYLMSKKYFFLSSLIEICEDALVSEISNLPFGSQGRFHNARSFLSLAEEYARPERMDAGITTVLSCFAQIASLLVHFEKRPNHWNALSPNDRIIVGLCTGLITGAVASTVKSVRDLLYLAPEVVRLALRLGVAVDHRSMHLEHSRANWARIVYGVAASDVEMIIGDFQLKSELYSAKRPYISAVGDSTTVTVSGPPSTLALLWEFSPRLQGAVFAELPIAAAFHADHLGEIKVNEVLGNGAVFRRYSQNGIFISPSSGKQYEGQDLEKLLRFAIVDIVQMRLDWTATIQSLIQVLKSGPVVLNLIGPSNAAKKLTKSLEGAGIQVEHEHDAENAEDGLLSRVGSGLVAIVGMSGRFPGAENLDSFWQHLVDGDDQHRKVPADRFDLDSHFDATGSLKNTTLSPYGCFIDRPGVFDARMFSMSPREAAQTDPGHRLMLLTAYEALEMAGYTPNGTPSTNSSRIGTFFGQTIDDYREHNASQEIDMYYATAGIRAFGPGRLNYHFKWEGPSYSVDTACSSSSVAVQLAFRSLLSRECDTAVAGGANILTGSDMYAGLSRGGFLSPSGPCKTFDKDADGYCRADGVGTVVLKRLEDAIRDRDNIQAVILSASTNHSAQAISITHPHQETQKELFRKVLQDAGVEPHNVDYVEMHGTGTQAGDAIEYGSVSETFGNDRLRKNPLFIGTVKPNIGHSEAASGVTSLIKAVMMFRKNLIPPHSGIKEERNPKLCSLEQKGLRIASGPTAFDPPKKDGTEKRTILLNNFSAAGGNTSIIIQDGLQTRRSGIDPRPRHIVTVSGKTGASLRQNIKNLLEWLNANGGVQLSDVAYTTTARRMHHARRKSYVTISIDELKSRMVHDLATLVDSPPVSDRPRLGFVFTGQGSQYLGMAKELLAESKFFRDSVESLNEFCLSHSWPSIMEIFTAEPATLLPIQLQVGIVCLDLSLAKLWQSWGLQPDVVMGHSLGEYAALCFAGVISASDMIYVVGKRALLIQEHCVPNSHCMLAVRASLDEVVGTLAILDLECDIACINGPENIVVSGTIDIIEILYRHFEEKMIKSTFLPAQYAFHSKQMDPILTGLQYAAQNIEFQKPEIPVASTLYGDMIRDRGIFCPSYLVMQARKCVEFTAAVQAYSSSHSQAKDTLWVECGPGGGCAGMIRSIIGNSQGKALPSIKKNENSWKTVTNALAELHNAGANVQWREFHRPYETSLKLLDLPTYAFDLKNHWLQYKGNWSITKNDRLRKYVPPTPETPPFRTSCLHRILSESTDENGLTVIFVSDFAEKEFSDMAKGHMVHGVALLPSSVYAEMAYSAASYVHSKKAISTGSPTFDLTNMEIFRPLIVTVDAAPQLVTLSATMCAKSDTISLSFTSGDGTKSIQHATCIVIVGNRETWANQWSQSSYLVADRIDRLRELASTGDAHIILRKMVYKLFTAVVTYDEKYHSLNQVFLHHDRPEAAASVVFRTPSADDLFTYSAYWIDCLAQLGGFVLNGCPSNPEDVVYISTGWTSMCIAGKLEQDKGYQSYVYMRPTSTDGLLVGDVYFLDGTNLVAMCRGLRFRQMKLSSLKSVLGVKQPVSLRTRTAEPKIEQQNLNTSNRSAVVLPPIKRKTPTGPSFDVIIQTIAAEIGVEINEIAADMPLEDLGVDSLLTMSILPKLRTITGLELSSSLFSTHPTVSALESFFGEQLAEEADASQEIPYDNSSADSVLSRTLPGSPSTDAILQIIANELGFDPSEIEPATDLAGLGLDSLMSISIIGELRNATGLTLSSSFFNENQCLLEVNQALGILKLSSACESFVTPVTPTTSKSDSDAFSVQSTSVLLQGSTSSKNSLFMLPDGSGSALSYINLPTLPFGFTVYGLNSPYLNSPEEFDLSLEAIAELYIQEIRRLQPNGPYLIAGWSMGGIYAYEVSRKLQESGRSVEMLILLDSPCPGFLPPLPAPTIDVLESSGLFDGLKKKGKGVSPSTRRHFLESVKVLGNYKPKRMKQSPEAVSVVWARDGVCENVSEDQQREAMAAAGALGVDKARDWLLGRRSEFGPNGWDKLVGDGNMECHVVHGNHFTIMNPQNIRAIADIIAYTFGKLMTLRNKPTEAKLS